MHILFVDDDPNMLRLVDLMLRNSPFEVEVTSSARIALHKLANQQFDLIVSDLQMPGMDEISFIKELRANNHKQKVIIMSAFGLKKLSDIALASGASLVLEKPFQKEQLVQAIKKITGTT